MTHEPPPDLGPIEHCMLDILRSRHEHHWAAIRREDLLILLNQKLRPHLDLFGGNVDGPEEEGAITDRRMRDARANLVKNHFPCYSGPIGYFYGTDERDEEIAKEATLKQYLALGEVLKNIRESASAEHERRTLGHRTEQLRADAVEEVARL